MGYFPAKSIFFAFESQTTHKVVSHRAVACSQGRFFNSDVSLRKLHLRLPKIRIT